jgi:hypothetical protein
MKYGYVLFLLVWVAGAVMAQGPDTLWTRTYGGASDDWGYDLIPTSDGNYVIAGYTRSFGTGAPNANVYLVRYSGWPSVPQQVVVGRSDNILVLNWADDNNRSTASIAPTRPTAP